jgi:SWI/SNF-related matrix-associated actin-dependent regulator of chromatin subfamily A-like protein 1
MGAKIVLSQEGNKALIRPSGYLGGDFNKFREAIEGSTFDGTRKLNVAPLDKVPRILKRLRDAGFPVEIAPDLGQSLEAFTAQNWQDLQFAKERADAIDEELKARGKALYPYQRVGVQWLATKYGALLADDMGLGKTAQTLAALPASIGVVVVAPALAKGVWKKEVPMWRPHLTPRVLEGRGNFRWPEKGEVIIVNYDILPEAHEKACKDKDCKGCAAFLKAVPKGTVVVADEAHNLKNSKAQRTLRFRAMAQAAREAGGRTWLLTATPLLNRPQELWSIYQAAGIAQEAFGTFKQFVRLFNGRPAKFGGFTWGEPNEEEIIERIRAVSLRRTKDEVLTDIPGKRIMTVPVDIDAKTLRLCDSLLEQMGGAERVLELLATKKLDFEKLSAVRAALASAKIPAMVAHIEEYEEPLVVFSAHRAPVDLLREREGWRVITGDTSSEERSEIVERFQNGELKGIGCTIKAGGVAITLTRACHELFVDREWTPGLNAQAEDRCYRIGQKRGVLVKVLEADHILDSRMNELLGLKQAMIDASVEAARETIFSGLTDLDAGIRSQIQAVQEALKASSESEPPPSDEDAPDAPPTRRKPARRVAHSEQEKWAENALMTLSGLDSDRASVRNDVGFNRMDGVTGHSLARQLPQLTEAQWRLAIQICRKYHGQVGECPTDEEEVA